MPASVKIVPVNHGSLLLNWNLTQIKQTDSVHQLTTKLDLQWNAVNLN